MPKICFYFLQLSSFAEATLYKEIWMMSAVCTKQGNEAKKQTQIFSLI